MISIILKTALIFVLISFTSSSQIRDQQSIFTMVLKYGLGTGFNIHAKAGWLLSFVLFGIIDYSIVSGEGEGEPGKGKLTILIIFFP